MIDLDAFEERAAIMEFDGGMTRFRAETLAAETQGFTRWQVMQEKRDAERDGHSPRGRDHGSALDGQQRADDLSRVQPRQAEEVGPMPERDTNAGRDRVELLALQSVGRGVL